MIRNIVRTGDESVIRASLERKPPSHKTYGVSYEDCADLRAKVNRAVEEVEKNTIRACLRRHSGNRRRVAEQLRVSYRSLLYKMKQYGLRSVTYGPTRDTQ